MAHAHVTYDKRSGQIVGIHHGTAHADDAKKIAQRLLKKLQHEHLDVLTVEAASLEPHKPYKVDVARKALVSASPEEAGVRVGFGKTGSASASGSTGSSKKG
jgi:hypothetical protein